MTSMTPEQAADKAAAILDEARETHLITDAAASLVGIADGWTRLYTALSTAVPAEALTKIRDVHEIQGRDGTWDMDEYMRGMYNGLELAVSILEGERKPRYRSPVPGAPNHNEMAGLYRERAALVAHLAAAYPSTLVYDADPEAPGWPVIYVNTPHGQLSWHLSGDDLDLFGHVPVFKDGQAPTWDGHTTEQKYERLAACVKDTADDQRYAT